ncbi:FeoB-associated Cys-rich membrane protein [Clostridium sp. Marseille-Q2269]|uniref:FeoB-associated Cys-rich membrane protein n=1 Tax=Clostridium sp. Marseille-Q2269 TaxID=2942205 RepID=UPI0020732A98|nr:FeoB-associated Cys-rich membrane protein [Clostridium sp. Marseille-Q2269]
MEIIIAIVIICLAVYILAKSLKKKTSGQCDCSSCPTGCSCCNKEGENKDKV